MITFLVVISGLILFGTGLLAGVSLERIEWNRLIADGWLPRPGERKLVRELIFKYRGWKLP